MKKLILSLLICVLSANTFFANTLADEINTSAEKILPKVIEWRRHLHKYPELGNREFKTAE